MFRRSGPYRDLHSFLHDALPISALERRTRERRRLDRGPRAGARVRRRVQPEAIESVWYRKKRDGARTPRSEEHTSELQSHSDLVCRLLLEKKKGLNQSKLTRIVR